MIQVSFQMLAPRGDTIHFYHHFEGRLTDVLQALNNCFERGIFLLPRLLHQAQPREMTVPQLPTLFNARNKKERIQNTSANCANVYALLAQNFPRGKRFMVASLILPPGLLKFCDNIRGGKNNIDISDVQH